MSAEKLRDLSRKFTSVREQLDEFESRPLPDKEQVPTSTDELTDEFIGRLANTAKATQALMRSLTCIETGVKDLWDRHKGRTDFAKNNSEFDACIRIHDELRGLGLSPGQVVAIDEQFEAFIPGTGNEYYMQLVRVVRTGSLEEIMNPKN